MIIDPPFRLLKDHKRIQSIADRIRFAGLTNKKDHCLGFRRDPVYYQLLSDLYDPLRRHIDHNRIQSIADRIRFAGLTNKEDHCLGFRRDPVYYKLIWDLYDPLYCLKDHNRIRSIADRIRLAGLTNKEDHCLGFRRDPLYNQLLSDLYDPLRRLSHLRCTLTGQHCGSGFKFHKRTRIRHLRKNIKSGFWKDVYLGFCRDEDPDPIGSIGFWPAGSGSGTFFNGSGSGSYL